VPRVKGRGPIVTSIDLTGPFFVHDPAKTFRQNIRLLMDVLAAEGEADVKTQMRSGEGGRRPMRGIIPERVSGHVVGRTSSLRGRRWAVTAVVSVNNSRLSPAQGKTLMAAASVLEGRHGYFRRTAGRLRKARKNVELLKGIA
jgi:hypothetical protein